MDAGLPWDFRDLVFSKFLNKRELEEQAFGNVLT